MTSKRSGKSIIKYLELFDLKRNVILA